MSGVAQWAAGALGRVCESENGHSSKCSSCCSNYPQPQPWLALRRWRAKKMARVVLRDGVHGSIAIYRRSFDDAGSVLVLGTIDDGVGSRHRGGHALSRSVELDVSAGLRR